MSSRDPTSPTRGRGRRKKEQDTSFDSTRVNTGAGTSYAPPTLDASVAGSYSGAGAGGGNSGGEDYNEYYSPTKRSSLTGNISSLFRRSASKDGRKNKDNPKSPKSPLGGGSGRRRGNKGLEDPATSPRPPAPRRSSGVSSPPTSPRVVKASAADAIEARAQKNHPFNAAAKKARRNPTSASAKNSSSKSNTMTNRLFYSSHGDDVDDDDSGDEDSYESRANQSQMTGQYTRETTDNDDYYSSSGVDNNTSATSENDDDKNNAIGTILRFRGFSTSIQNLFLDEALVCASMGCFGLILSNRTEYLLQLRNDRRGVRWGRSTSRRTLPSRIVAYALLLTVILISITFIIWGFGTDDDQSSLAAGFYGGYSTSSSGKNSGSSSSSSSSSNQYNDDAAAAANGDDANYQQQQNDDQNQQQNDDQVQGDDANANGDDGNDAYYYNGGNRLLDTMSSFTSKALPTTTTTMKTTLCQSSSSSSSCPHPTHGIFKIRDMHEGLWEPAIDFLKDEWYRGGENQPTARSVASSTSTRRGEGGDGQIRALNQNNNYAYYTDDYATDDYTQQVDKSRDLAADLRLAFIFAFLIVLGVLGRRRRMRTRYYLVRARAQEDHLFYASSGAGVKRVAFQDSREDQYEGACSHTLCGCYPIDPPMDGDEIDDDVKVDDDGVTQLKKTPHHHDCVSRGFSCLMACCCGLICRCWFQCMSICALAQEAREIRLLVPTRYQRVDYITHQPFNEYQKNVNDLRREWLGKSRNKLGFMLHFHALSRLSRYILAVFLISFIVITTTLIFNPRASFSWPDLVILIATFVQSFCVIYLVHWIFHKSDLSFDAVIKFFAAGFLIAVPAAFFFEGLLVNILLTFAYTGYAIGVSISDTFNIWVVDNYRLCWIVGEFINAYIVAAITEELCKYYTFRCVEHPDLIFLTGLARSAQDERAVAGGIVKYPFSSHQVQETNQRGAYDDDDDQSVSSRASHRSTRSRRSQTQSAKSSPIIDLSPMAAEEEFYEDENDIRTARQRAGAVTTGMISVAIGLACAENFLYVFVLGGSEANSGDVQSGGVIEEWIVLLFRSLFPVHALAAAIQSINVIRKYVECDTDDSHRIGVGRIILPAVLMHGTFDAVLLAINMFIETSWDNYLEKNEGNFDPDHPPYNPILVNLVAWFSIVFVMFAGFSWYYREHRLQTSRLLALEAKEKAERGGESTYRNPDLKSAGKKNKISEVELV